MDNKFYKALSLFAILINLSVLAIPLADADFDNFSETQGFKVSTFAAVLGEMVYDRIHNIGDINNDGFEDIALNSVDDIFIIFGSENRSEIDPYKLDDAQGFKISTKTNSVCGIGDINQDGYNDFIFGGSEVVAAYVIFGRNNFSQISINNLTETDGFKITKSTWYESTLTSFDINNDGFEDLIFGMPSDSPLNRERAGAVYVILGRSSGISTDFVLEYTYNFKIIGAEPNDRIGSLVRNAGDFNNDGIDDLIIRAHKAQKVPKTAYIIFGRDKEASSDIDLAAIYGTQGFMIAVDPLYKKPDIYDLLFLVTLYGTEISSLAVGPPYNMLDGIRLDRAGDLNNDGIGDLVIGVGVFQEYSTSPKPAIYVIFGQDSGFFSNINLTTLNATQGFIITPEERDSKYDGFSVVNRAGDVNGDGIDDLIFGINPFFQVRRPSAENTAQAWVLYGRSDKNFSNINLNNPLDSTRGIFIMRSIPCDYLGALIFKRRSLDNEKSNNSLVIFASNARYNAWENVFGNEKTRYGSIYVVYDWWSDNQNSSSSVTPHTPNSLPDSSPLTSPSQNIPENLGPTTAGMCSRGQYLQGPACLHCPDECLECTSRTECQSCSEGYTLQNSSCVVSVPEQLSSSSNSISGTIFKLGAFVVVFGIVIAVIYIKRKSIAAFFESKSLSGRNQRAYELPDVYENASPIK